MKRSYANARHCMFCGILCNEPGYVKHLMSYHQDKLAEQVDHWTLAAKYFVTKEEWQRKKKIEKLKVEPDWEMLYSKMLHYYIDKKGLTQDQANKKVQEIISKQKADRAAAKKELLEKLI